MFYWSEYQICPCLILVQFQYFTCHESGLASLAYSNIMALVFVSHFLLQGFMTSNKVDAALWMTRVFTVISSVMFLLPFFGLVTWCEFVVYLEDY